LEIPAYQGQPGQIEGVSFRKLDQCLEAINKRYGKNSLDPEAVFYTMVARGYMAMIYNYRGEMMNAAGEGKKAYNAFVEGFETAE
jgi:hypothetical protein